MCFQTFASVPAFLKNIPQDYVTEQSVQSLNSEFQGDRIAHALPNSFTGGKIPLILESSVQKLSSKFIFVTQKFQLKNQLYYINMTLGESSKIGEIIGNDRHWYIISNEDKTWSVDTNNLGQFESERLNDTVGTSHLSGLYKPQSSNVKRSNQINGITIVDVLLIYTPNIVSDFPGELTQTLLHHLVAQTNQAFVNSDVDVQLRLVGTELVNYTKASNFDALSDLSAALDRNSATVTDSSLSNLATVRDSLGADLVSMIRTHDLDERDVCGVARFPNSQTDELINISNVGISGGSNCGLTFTHEIGHNFGAGHQAVNGQSQGALDNSGALIVSGKFNTIMSSIGTGDDNRALKLNVFSNTENFCGAIVCGNDLFADNATTIEAFALQNANLRESVVPIGNIAFPIKTFPDNDGDGIPNNADAFPFLSSETLDSDNDGIGDESDLFPNDPSEVADFDKDGLGNNADLDDDNDGVFDALDDLPFNRNESIDSDGDGIGDNTDDLINNFQEYLDSDQDGQGDLSDSDDDNDGVDDFNSLDSLENTNLIVVSAGSDQILEFDAQSGTFIQTLLSVEPGSFSFRSDIEVAPNNELFFISQSDVFRFDRQQNRVQLAIDRSELVANFPKHITFIDQQRMLVTNDSSADVIETFRLSEQGIARTGQFSDEVVIRDVLPLSNNRILFVNKLDNQLEILALNQPNNPRTVFANTQMNKPEHLSRDQNGNIFVTNSGDNSITRFNSNGIAIVNFTLPNNYPASCIEVGPDNNLYVCSRQTNEILILDSNSGDLVKTAVVSGSGGLSQPVSLAFVGKPLDLLPYAPTNDSDNDGVENQNDDLPLDPTETVDTDNDGLGNNSDTDDDNDGMPDTFEVANNFDPLNANDANQDADNDGASNLAEFNVGTDPRSPDSPESDNDGGGGTFSILWLFLLTLISIRPTLRNKWR